MVIGIVDRYVIPQLYSPEFKFAYVGPDKPWVILITGELEVTVKSYFEQITGREFQEITNPEDLAEIKALTTPQNRSRFK